MVLHAVLGGAIFALPFISKIYSILILFYGIYYVFKYKNNNHEALYVCGYIIGSELILRMTGGSVSYEFSKYCVIFFLLMGMYYKGFSKYAVPYWVFIVLLIPGIVVSMISLDYDIALRKSIAFNISGPVCLAIASIYMYNRKITINQISTIILNMGLPVVSCAVYLIFIHQA